MTDMRECPTGKVRIRDEQAAQAAAEESARDYGTAARWYRYPEVGLADAYSNLLRAERLLANAERGR